MKQLNRLTYKFQVHKFHNKVTHFHKIKILSCVTGDVTNMLEADNENPNSTICG